MDWSYVFGDGESGSSLTKESVYYRLNTKGTDTAQLAELFLAPKETYQYTMVAGKTTADYLNSSLYQTKARLLVNTTAVQAAADVEEGVVAITKWEQGSTRVDNQVVSVTLDAPVAAELKKDPSSGAIALTVAKLPSQSEGTLEVILESAGKQILSNSNPAALLESTMGERIVLKFDTAAMGEQAVIMTIEGKVPDTLTGEEITLVRGQDGRIKAPESLTGTVEWSVKIPKLDGNLSCNDRRSVKGRFDYSVTDERKKRYESNRGGCSGQRLPSGGPDG